MTYTQSPDEKIPYGVRVFGDTVINATWTIDNGGTVSNDTITSTTAVAFASGLTLGQSYDLEVHIIMQSGQERDQCFEITCVAPCD